MIQATNTDRLHNGEILSIGSLPEDHGQLVRPQQDGLWGIDSIIEGIQSTKLEANCKSQRPDGTHAPFSNLIHHDKASAPPHSDASESCRLVLTMMYNTNSCRNPALNEPSTAHAPVHSVPDFPLEPPPSPPEPLNHLYGSYITPQCVSSFLQLIPSFQTSSEWPNLIASHRFLDNPLHPTVVEFTVSPPDQSFPSLSDIRKHEFIFRFEREWNVTIDIQRDTVFRRYPRLICFDMDSTLITDEVIDLIAASIGVEAEVSEITERAMNGELDFESSLRARVKLLEGIDEKVFTELQSKIVTVRGARELIKALNKIGVRTAVLSGGFRPLALWLAGKLGINYAHANNLSVLNGRFTGEVEGTIIDAEKKRSLLFEIARSENISIEQVVAVGDGANDLLMLGAASLGVAWNAKPLVQMQAHVRLNRESILDLMYLFGFTNEEITTLIS